MSIGKKKGIIELEFNLVLIGGHIMYFRRIITMITIICIMLSACSDKDYPSTVDKTSKLENILTSIPNITLEEMSVLANLETFKDYEICNIVPMVDINEDDSSIVYTYDDVERWYLVTLKGNDTYYFALHSMGLNKTVLFDFDNPGTESQCEQLRVDVEKVFNDNYSLVMSVIMSNGIPFDWNNTNFIPTLWLVCKDESNDILVYKGYLGAPHKYITEIAFEQGVRRFFDRNKIDTIYGGVKWIG